MFSEGGVKKTSYFIDVFAYFTPSEAQKEPLGSHFVALEPHLRPRSKQGPKNVFFTQFGRFWLDFRRPNFDRFLNVVLRPLGCKLQYYHWFYRCFEEP